MLSDPDFHVGRMVLRNLHFGVVFSAFKTYSPMGNYLIDAIAGKTIPTNEEWIIQTGGNTTQTVMLVGRHSKGIYFSNGMDDSIDHFSSTELLCRYPDFDLGTGQWYSEEEFRESYNRKWSDGSSPLSTGKAFPNKNSMIRSYGVADNITQILKKFRKVVSNQNYDVVLDITYLGKDSLVGRRWHKQGPYIGVHKKKGEFISDNVKIESMIKYQFYVIVNKTVDSTEEV